MNEDLFMTLWELLLTVVISAAICTAYFAGQRTRPLTEIFKADSTRYRVRRTSLLLTYRNADGLTSSLHTTIIKAQHYSDGRISLLGICGPNNKVREFRADRIVATSSLTGQSLELNAFLIHRLGLSPNKVALALAPKAPPTTGFY